MLEWLLGGLTSYLNNVLLDHSLCLLWPTLFLLLIYFLSLDMLRIDLDLLKVFCVLTDKFTKQKISSLNGLEGLFVK